MIKLFLMKINLFILTFVDNERLLLILTKISIYLEMSVKKM